LDSALNPAERTLTCLGKSAQGSGADTKMQSPSRPSIPPFTAQRVFGSWPFDFEFLWNKANHELVSSMKEGSDLFLPNALNFSVTIHAIADHLWYTGENRNPQWAEYGKFLN
jgi:hypothetical protein